MPIEQLIMSAMAVLMLTAALTGTTAMANPFRGADPDRESHTSGTQVPARTEKVECLIEQIDLKELKLTGRVEDVSTVFKVVPQVRVMKDQRPAKLESLARGDFATLTLASAGSHVVVRIDAMSSR